jgi:polyferredoxin
MIKFFINASRILFLIIFLLLVTRGAMVMWLGIFGVTMILALLLGRIFCGWICPMNTVMLPTEWLSKKLNLQTKDAPNWLKSGVIPWIMLFIMIATMIFAKRMFGVQIPILLYLVIFSVIVTLRYKPEIFHNYICPFEPLQNLTGKFALFTEKVNHVQCIGCKLCETVCPSEAVKVSKKSKKANINPGLCHQCFNCQLICPENAISYGRKASGNQEG